MTSAPPPPLLNLFAALPEASADEHIEVLLDRPGIRLERIVSHGQASPPGYWYDQEDGEWVMVLRGQARLRLDGEAEDRVLGPGDYLYLAPHVRHRVAWTAPHEPTVWLALFVAEAQASSIA